jgi:hypothetical protein
LDGTKNKNDRNFWGEAALFTIREILDNVFRDEGFTPTYFIVDALDKFHNGLDNLMTFIRDFLAHGYGRDIFGYLEQSGRNESLQDNSGKI